MEELKELFKTKADGLAAEIRDILKVHGNRKVGEVTLSQLFFQCSTISIILKVKFIKVKGIILKIFFIFY